MKKNKTLRARVKARRCIVQALYQHHIANQSAQHILVEFGENTKKLKDVDLEFFEDLLTAIISEQQQLNQYLQSWLDRPFSELDPIELSILQLGCYQLEHRPDIPWKVVINESIELAKLFGAEQSHKYINSVLDKLAQSLHARKDERLKQ